MGFHYSKTGRIDFPGAFHHMMKLSALSVRLTPFSGASKCTDTPKLGRFERLDPFPEINPGVEHGNRVDTINCMWTAG